MKLAFVFPGQGSQSLGMLQDLAKSFPVILQTFAEASNTLGYDTWALAQEGPIEKLNLTEFTQPVMLTADIALWRSWLLQNGAIPEIMAGHSLGEYSALVAAESLSFKDALLLVAKRGRYMQEAVPANGGAMAAIVGLSESQVIEICESYKLSNEVLSAANFNTIGQTVIAGHAEAVDRVLPIALSAGAKIAKRIPVSVPSHCLLMEPAALRLAEDLSHITLRVPKISVIHNYDLKWQQDPVSLRQALVYQLTFPVRWVETIQLMSRQGVEFIIECGPGKVLSGLNKRIESGIVNGSLADADAFNKALSLRMMTR